MKATTIRISDDTLCRIDGLATVLNRSRSWVIKEALERFLSYEEWFVQEVTAGQEEVVRGEIATDNAVAESFRKWGVDAS
jgi:predicted transcriptional regulator